MHRKPLKVLLRPTDDGPVTSVAYLEQAGPDSPVWHKRGFSSEVYPGDELQEALDAFQERANELADWPPDTAEKLRLNGVSWKYSKYHRLRTITLEGERYLVRFKIEVSLSKDDELCPLLHSLWRQAEAFIGYCESEAAKAQPDLFEGFSEEGRQSAEFLRREVRSGRMSISIPEVEAALSANE